MPIQKTNGGYKWGKHGKVYPTRAGAAKQARAAYASGYEGYQGGGIIKDSWVRDWLKSMGQMGIMSNPKARQLLPLLMGLKQNVPLKNIGKFYAQQAARNQGIQSLFKKVGPWGTLLSNQGGPLGLGILGSNRPVGSKIQQILLDPRVAGRLKFAQAFPQIAGLGWLMNKISPRIEGQRGPLGQGLGPQLGNLASKLFGIKSTEQAKKDFGTGIMGGTLGPRIRNLLGLGSRKDESPIQEIEVTAQKRQTPEEEAAGIHPGAQQRFASWSSPFAASQSEAPPLLSGLAGVDFPSTSLRGRFLPSVDQLMAAEGMSTGSFFGDDNYAH